MNQDDGQGGPSEQNTLQETSPSGLSQSSGEMGRVWWMEKFLQLIVLPRLKIPKSVSFEDSDLSENQNPDTEIFYCGWTSGKSLRERH